MNGALPVRENLEMVHVVGGLSEILKYKYEETMAVVNGASDRALALDEARGFWECQR
jgi:hypothetical protein